MKRLLFTSLLSLIAFNASAQIAHWLIPPLYNDIEMMQGVDLIKTDSVNNKKIVWTVEGKRLFETSDMLYPFSDGLAVSTKPNSSLVTSVYKTDGTHFEPSQCYVEHQYPYFSCGRLLVRHNNRRTFVNNDGTFMQNDFKNACPFMNNYAVCEDYMNVEKQKDPYTFLIDTNGAHVPFIYENKVIDERDIDFVSAVNDENKAFLVVKRRVYIFDGVTQEVTPVFLTDEAGQPAKNQAKLENDFALCCTTEADSTVTFKARCGKMGTATFVYDRWLRPISIERTPVNEPNGNLHVYKMKEEQEKQYSTPMKFYQKGELFGISWDGNEMLPPQFQNYRTCIDNKAMVKIDGKYGFLELNKDEHFKLSMNKGNDIGFRHQKFDTNIRLDMPTYISEKVTGIEIDPATGCNLDMQSKSGKNTEYGNVVTYDCTLNIPMNLTEDRTELNYPVTVKYDGITSSLIPLKVKAWHQKHFNVDVDETQITVQNGEVSFMFDLSIDRLPNESDFHTDVKVKSENDSLTTDCFSSSATRYRGRAYPLVDGINEVAIHVTEDGCPPAIFPLVIEYTKPAPATKSSGPKKEKVTITKKLKKTSHAPSINLDGPRESTLSSQGSIFDKTKTGN